MNDTESISRPLSEITTIPGVSMTLSDKRTKSCGSNDPWRTLALCSSKTARAEIPYEQAMALSILPLSLQKIASDMELLIAVPDSENEFTLSSHLKLLTAKRCIFKKIDNEILKKAILIAYKEDEASRTILELNKPSDKLTEHSFKKRIQIDLGKVLQAEAPKLLQALLTLAYKENASDIHLESTQDEKSRTSFRIDGALQVQEHIQIPQYHFLRLIQHIKVISGLDITEHFAPLDGMFEFSAGNGNIRVRISIIPTVHGIKLAMRLLYHPLLDEVGLKNIRAIDILGLSNIQKQTFLNKIQKKGGLILLSGPTGSGKSTLLYGLITEAAKGNDKNIISIEDPVERTIAGITQIEVDTREKMSYHSIFKSTLRQDPDIIVLSEIREQEALQTALQASLSGTIVISTIHASNVIELILRLFEMGCSPIALGATLKVASSQRLLQRNCPYCRVRIPCPEELETHFGSPLICSESSGCEKCNFTKIMGRLAAYETCEPSLALISELSRMHSSGVSAISKSDFNTCLHQSNYIPFSNALHHLLTTGEISPSTARTLYF